MSRELTEKKRRNITPSKGVVEPKLTQPPYRDYRTPYTGNTQAVFTEVDGKKVVTTHYLLNAFIKNLKNGTHEIESKAESDKRWYSLFSKDLDKILPEGYTKQDYKDYIHECLDPIDHNFSYTFTSHGVSVYEPVDFKVTKINRTYGFTRQDNGECCNFTIVKDGNGGFTYKLQELDYFNLPEWVGGWWRKDTI